jgi:hypothetical protein
LCAVTPSPRLPAVLRHVVYNGEEFVANQVSSILVTMEVGSNHDFKTLTVTEQFECCYHSIQSLLSPHLLSKNVNVKIYKHIVLSLVLCGCETWSPTLRENHRVRLFENRVLRRIFGSNRDEVVGEWNEGS